MIKRTAGKAKFKGRHLILTLSFLLSVVIPSSLVSYYQFFRALDQYVSTVAFTVRSENVSSAVDLLGGLSALGSGSSSDTDVLFEFIQSKALVAAVDDHLDLRRIYSSDYDSDPWYSSYPNGTIEDLTEYWPRMVKLAYDQGTGLIEVQVRAFTAKASKAIAEAIYSLSSDMINKLNNIARSDAISYARDELDRALAQLRKSRSALVEFRSRNKMVNPQAEIEMQTGVINALQNQLSEILVEYDLILASSNIEDPRLAEISQRIDVVKFRIIDERKKFAAGNNDDLSYSKLIGEFEGLMVDREYAETAYLAALATYDRAVVEAQRQSRYLAPYVKPTIAERPEHPRRFLISALSALGAFLAWFTFVIFFYAVRDRR